MRQLMVRFKNCENGATAIEYGLMAAFIGVAIVVTVQALGTQVSANLQYIADQFASFLAP